MHRFSRVFSHIYRVKGKAYYTTEKLCAINYYPVPDHPAGTLGFPFLWDFSISSVNLFNHAISLLAKDSVMLEEG